MLASACGGDLPGAGLAHCWVRGGELAEVLAGGPLIIVRLAEITLVAGVASCLAALWGGWSAGCLRPVILACVQILYSM
ncbi:hypothetical protein AB838_17030 [Rhodobacteraceae bacterium (ex Bugula neritina AB1)]|nr:hypothetical protein AB838_17030 [Rhodobacteraceae bacterium (ex Bugula neritina AB1)]